MFGQLDLLPSHKLGWVRQIWNHTVVTTGNTKRLACAGGGKASCRHHAPHLSKEIAVDPAPRVAPTDCHRSARPQTSLPVPADKPDDFRIGHRSDSQNRGCCRKLGI